MSSIAIRKCLSLLRILARYGLVTGSEIKPWKQNWTVVKQLGGGGQGDTFIVKNVSDNNSQAVLKLLRDSKSDNPKARRRMFQEVNNLRALHNAGGNVPALLDSNAGEFEQPSVQLYLVMEYVAGPTLAEVVQQRNCLSVDESVGIAIQLCKTLQIAATERISHRDIKPENLVLRNLEVLDVVIVDFGLSFNENDVTKLTDTDETLDNKFISLPERRGPTEDKRDPRSDLTGICAILFYCLTGCSPRNLRDSQGRPPHRWPEYQLQSRVSNEKQLSMLNLLLDRGLSYEIDSRFQNADTLKARLQEVITPSPQPIIEDFESEIARELATLRRVDRKTQLEQYYANATTLQQPLQLAINDVATRMRNQKEFTVFSSNSIARGQGRCEFGDVVAVFEITVFLAVHGRQHLVRYQIASEGPECEIYRDIRFPQSGNDSTIIQRPVLIARYHGEQMPDAHAIVADVKPAVLHAVRALTSWVQQIQKPRARIGLDNSTRRCCSSRGDNARLV